ncbi:cytochrome c [Oryzomicrobium terrae]|uniref:Cytochrome c n=1 Tax=Oryzomicrobium terrae TaxID=1735038 RepID=A0A5C1E4Y0_9RHOO|nr:c-type cytochrome [Oryzomicrobium terrae]QEL63579.1 cytochrome c [Oryzomicrobium terrae]
MSAPCTRGAAPQRSTPHGRSGAPGPGLGMAGLTLLAGLLGGGLAEAEDARRDKRPAALQAQAGLAGSAGADRAEERDGAAVYAQVCAACHGDGTLGAPRFGDVRRWRGLIKEGLDDLVPSALAGIRAMPPRGGDATLTDRDVARAVIHMTNAAGARFAEPSAAQLDRWAAKAERRLRKAATKAGGAPAAVASPATSANSANSANAASPARQNTP